MTVGNEYGFISKAPLPLYTIKERIDCIIFVLMATQQLYISLKKYSTCGSNFWWGKCKDRGQAMRISEMIKLCYFYSHWGVDNKTLYFNVEVTPGRVFGCVSAESRSLEYKHFFFVFFFNISPAVAQHSCLVLLIWPSGSCQDARRRLPVSFPKADKTGPWLLFLFFFL